MGLLITSCLITWNIYGSIDAPTNRGFSKIELWIAGMQSTILMATLEYLLVLLLNRNEINDPRYSKKGRVTKVIDFISFALTVVFFITFNIVYWC